MAGLAPKAGSFRFLTNAIGALSLTASRYAVATLLVIGLLTAVFGYGATKLTTNVDVADVLPRGDHNTTAAKLLTKEFKSAFTMQVTLQFHVDGRDQGYQFQCGPNFALDSAQKLPLRRTSPNCKDVRDEVYIRAMAQAVEFMKEQDPLICCSIGLSDLYKLINWTIADGQSAPDSAWNLPPTDAQGEIAYRAVDEGARAAIPDALDALASPNWTTAAQLLIPRADETATTREIGERAIAARDAYVAWAEANPDIAYQVFTGDNKPLLTVELPVANAHSSELTKEDFSRLLPLIAGFIVIVLYIAFRNIGAVVITFSALALGTLWTYGIEGFMGFALNPLNLTLMPLIMGIGIDYAIHVTNEFQEHKANGLSHQDAFREVGRRAGMALFIATLTTVVGLGVMVMSPSVLIAEYAILASLSIIIMLLLVLVFIPAALTLWPNSHKMGAAFRPSVIFPLIGVGVAKIRVVTIVVVLILTGVGAVASNQLFNESFGDPGRNYLQSDPVRQEHEQGLKWFYEVRDPEVKANVLTFEGDLTNPQAHQYMRAIERELQKQPRVIPDTLRTIPFLMETWLTVKNGGEGALAYLGQGQAGAPPYPASAAEIRREFEELYATPVAELGSIFTNGPVGGLDFGVMTFSVRADSYEEAEEVWHQVWSAVGNATALKPADIQVSFVGNTATNYLFVAKEVPWVFYMGTAANVVLFLFLVPFFRSWRPIAAIMLVNFATTAWWLGILPQLGIGLAITLVLPLIFISAVGTDYAVHMCWSIRQVGNAWEVFQTTGKAILFSFVTALGPFLIFTGIQDLSVRKTMVATALAIVLIFIVTILTIPAFYPPRKDDEELPPDEPLPILPPAEVPLQATGGRVGPTVPPASLPDPEDKPKARRGRPTGTRK